MKKTIILLTIITVVSLLGYSIWKLSQREVVKPTQTAVLIDYSNSRPINCPSLTSLMNEVYALPNIKKGSKIQFYATSDKTTSNEPILFATYDLPTSGKIIEDKQIFVNEKIELIGKITDKCRQQNIKKSSPIVLAVKRIIENLKSKGCNQGNTCVFYIQSDGEELVEKKPEKIENGSIKIKLCGLAEVLPSEKPHSIQSVDKLNDFWKNLFTNSENVEIYPFCS